MDTEVAYKLTSVSMISMTSRTECVNQTRPRYHVAKRSEKTKILDELCHMTEYSRKHALALLNGPKKIPRIGSSSSKRARKYSLACHSAILFLWRSDGEICAERLHPFIPDLLECLIRCKRIAPDPDTKAQILLISLASVKRILRKEKRRSVIRIGGTTKPGSLLKHQIAIRTGPWNETEPGWMEMDTVAHCGDSLQGQFLSTLDLIDVYSHWSEQVALLGSSGEQVESALTIVSKDLPFTLKGLDPDNGSEFINWSIYWFCKREGLDLTRSRPGKKNDNAHIEQKNWTAVRQLIGYMRLETKEQCDMLNDLYRNEWRLFLNFFQPTQKLKEKHFTPDTGKTKRIYEKAQTPYQRIMACATVEEVVKEKLKLQYEQLDPVTLLENINLKLERIKKSV